MKITNDQMASELSAAILQFKAMAEGKFYKGRLEHKDILMNLDYENELLDELLDTVIYFLLWKIQKTHQSGKKVALPLLWERKLPLPDSPPEKKRSPKKH